MAPTTSAERVAFITQRWVSIVYCVSLAGVTGARQDGPTNISSLVGRVKEVSPLPVAVRFGVSRPEHVRAVAATGADGAVVGSALVDALGPDGTDTDRFAKLCAELAAATDRPALPRS